MSETGSHWRILLCERPTGRGKHVLKFLFGRLAGHVFLALADDTMTVRDEMHPFVMSLTARDDRPEKTYTLDLPRTVYALEYADTFANMLGVYPILQRVVQKTSIQKHRSTICIWFPRRMRDAHRRVSEQVVVEGNEQKVLSEWKKIRETANSFNRRSIPYSQLSPAGQYNCQAAVRQVMDDCGYPTSQRTFKLWISGWDPQATIGGMVKSILVRRAPQ